MCMRLVLEPVRPSLEGLGIGGLFQNESYVDDSCNFGSEKP
jgi:hypothetical protein